MSAFARLFRTTFIVFALASTLLAAAHATSPLMGTWKFDPEQSTDLSPWTQSELTLAQTGNRLTVSRTLRSGRRTHTESTTLDLTKSVNEVPQTWWVDNRHLGAYSPTDGTQFITARWLDADRILRLEIDFTLETQQGRRAVNTLRQFQISPDGQRLTVIDLRSTRPRPVTHVYTRVTE